MNDDSIASLLQQARSRPEPPGHIASQVRDAVEHGWTKTLEHRRRSRRRYWLAAAATAAAFSVLIPSLVRYRPAAPEDAGIYLASRGTVTITPERDGPATGGKPLPAGARIHTEHDGLMLLANGRMSIRVGPDSDVMLESARQIRLLRGRLYLDSGPSLEEHQPLTVMTSLGSIEHLGTQYQVRMDHDLLSVMVRDGQVRLATPATVQKVDAHQIAEVGATGHVQIRPMPDYGSIWAWTSDLHPDFAIEGRTLAEFLEWFTRETGQRVDYGSAAVQATAASTRLSGSVSGLAPQDALTAVLASTQFTIESSDAGVLRLKVRPPLRDRLRSHANGASAAEPGRQP